ncbi:MAG: hypothetical protein AAGA30_07625, partial [Planctomycetota bacterium]
FLRAVIRGLESENEPLNRKKLLDYLELGFWSLLEEADRKKFAVPIEELLWSKVDPNASTTLDVEAKSAYFKSLIRVFTSESMVQKLYEIWKTQREIGDLKLSELDVVQLGYELAVRLPEESQLILELLGKRIENPDRQLRHQFVAPSLSADKEIRDQFFGLLKNPKNRRPERWVLEAVSLLHHPLRANQAVGYVLPSLELMEDIQATGDIFFPKRWMVATLSGHRSKEVAETIVQFLNKRPNYSVRLRRKILQAADLLLRINGIN